MSSIEAFFQYLVSGITQGSIYAMIALGFTIIYNATTIINFAQGELVMMGAMFAVTLTMTLGLPLYISFPLAVVASTLLGALLYRLALAPMRSPSPIKLIIVTVGASIFLKGVAMLIWGKEALVLKSFSGDEPIRFGEVTMVPQHFWVIAVLTVSVLGLNAFYKKTITGKAMRACASNARAAGLMGIDVRRMTLFTWALSGMLGAAAGIVIAPLTMMSYHMGTMLGLKGFCAAILGGLGSTPGAIVGGVIIGVLENLGAGYISSSLKDAFAFFIMLSVLFVRPGGILGAKEMERV